MISWLELELPAHLAPRMSHVQGNNRGWANAYQNNRKLARLIEAIQFFDWESARRWSRLYGEPMITPWQNNHEYMKAEGWAWICCKYIEYRRDLREYCLARRRCNYLVNCERWRKILAALLVWKGVRHKTHLIQMILHYCG